MAKNKKICHYCKKEKSLFCFRTAISNKDGFLNICIDCEKLRNRTSKAKEIKSEENRKQTLMKRHNLTITQYQKLFDAQNGCCAICGKHQSELKKTLSVDHNHKTGVIRGLLCNTCNCAFETYFKYLKQFKNYLEISK